MPRLRRVHLAVAHGARTLALSRCRLSPASRMPHVPRPRWLSNRKSSLLLLLLLRLLHHGRETGRERRDLPRHMGVTH